MEDPFVLFPEEIWCMVLENVDDYDDVLSIAKAYPGMEALLKRVKLLGLIDQAVPFIAEWITEKELLACRLVSKQWSRAIDNFLENHPHHRAYSPDEEPIIGQLWDLKDYSMTFHCQIFISAHLYTRFFPQAYSFRDEHKFRRFQNGMEHHPPERNPFIGRAISLKPTQDDSRSRQKINLVNYWKQAITFLSRWGKHIWSIEIASSTQCHNNMTIKQSDYHLYQAIQQCLRLVPNLKNLRIQTEYRMDFPNRAVANQVPPPWREMFPNLPNLETIQIAFYGLPKLMENLLHKYCPQIRRFQVISSQLKDWKTEYSNLLPQLTELEITNIDGDWDEKSKKGVCSLLYSLNAPELHRLHMDFCGKAKHGSGATQKEILDWLKRYPKLRHFHFLGQIVKKIDNGVILGPGEFAPELTSLSIHDYSMESSFFLFFPSLECLEIHFKFSTFACNVAAERSQVYIESREWERGKYSFKFSQRVWDMLPKLKTLILVDTDLGIRDRICREMYDLCAKGLWIRPQEPQKWSSDPGNNDWSWGTYHESRKWKAWNEKYNKKK